MKRATEALVHEAQTRTRDAQGDVSQDDVDAAASVSVSGSKMVTGMAQVNFCVYLCLFTSVGPVESHTHKIQKNGMVAKISRHDCRLGQV